MPLSLCSHFCLPLVPVLNSPSTALLILSCSKQDASFSSTLHESQQKKWIHKRQPALFTTSKQTDLFIFLLCHKSLASLTYDQSSHSNSPNPALLLAELGNTILFASFNSFRSVSASLNTSYCSLALF